ncbi:2,3-dihydro-2,3-dihydroxybenzoate dehydrogenase [Marinimicrobium locisalis]|uniref:2,3-dihydro-2,3-dihydroxybenzoate dehydrogenase n=1 Tax=Marinimicrobium locisalis TaxID=546022 RepID=UPI0032221F31
MARSRTLDSSHAEPNNLSTGKVAVVTGAAGGIGASIVRQLAEAGHIVAAVDRNSEALQTMINELRDQGLSVYAFIVDIGSSQGVENFVNDVEHALGPIYYLVNAAGILRTGQITDMADDDWETTMRVNTSGVFWVSRAVSRRMLARGGKGALVTVASNAASTARLEMGAYAASKAAVIALTKCLGLELAKHGIRCNIVSPGSTETPMLSSLTGAGNTTSSIQGSQERYRVGIPLGRVARPSYVADAVMFLLSDQARHITMETLTVDGGATLGV